MRNLATTTVLFLIALAGCDSPRKSGRGFSLPDGNAEAGRAVFVQLQCNACHTAPGIEQLEGFSGGLSVALGGEVTRVSTYGELVTSIVNPSHRLAKSYAGATTEGGQSPMKNYNDVMTVRQLIDLVAFLQSQYTLVEYEPTEYPVYYYYQDAAGP